LTWKRVRKISWIGGIVEKNCNQTICQVLTFYDPKTVEDDSGNQEYPETVPFILFE
jgi:hypothetical protein